MKRKKQIAKLNVYMPGISFADMLKLGYAIFYFERPELGKHKKVEVVINE